MQRVGVGGPWFEDFTVGQVIADAPALTITTGHTAWHHAITGDRLRMALDADLSAAVTGSDRPLVSPGLVGNIAIGQTTWASQRVRANLFYRRLVLLRPVHVGDTLHTTTEIVALKQNRVTPGKPATGLVVLAVRTRNQHGEPVLDFWRCPMIPLRDPALATGHSDDLDAIPAELDPAAVASAVPQHWRLDLLTDRLPGPHLADLVTGTTYDVEPADAVTCAPELARLTLNLAAAHFDSTAGPYGRRLVYGGHTIAVAAGQVSRALPNLVTVLAWRSCDHTGPVFEGDELRSSVTVDGLRPLRDGVGLADLHVVTTATGAAPPGIPTERPVLDWRLIALL